MQLIAGKLPHRFLTVQSPHFETQDIGFTSGIEFDYMRFFQTDFTDIRNDESHRRWEFDGLWERNLTYWYSFLFFTNTPTPLQGVYVFVLLGGGSVVYGAILAQNTWLKYRHISLYSHRKIRCNPCTNAYRKESRHIRESAHDAQKRTWCTNRGKPKTM